MMAKVQIDRVFIIHFDELEFEVMMDALRKRDETDSTNGKVANHAAKLMYEILDGVSTAEGH